MRRILVGILLLMMLAACGPADYYTPLDAQALRATAQAYNSLAEQVETERRATEKAYQTQATQTAQAYQTTAQSLSLMTTQQAVDTTATANAMVLAVQSYQVTATAQALLRAQEQQKRQERLDEISAVALRILGFLVLLGVMGVMIGLLWQAGREWIHWQSQRWRLVESRAGTLVILPEGAPRGAEVEARVEDLEVLRVEVKRPPDRWR